MPLIFNGTNLPANYNVSATVGGVNRNITKIYANNVLVWSKQEAKGNLSASGGHLWLGIGEGNYTQFTTTSSGAINLSGFNSVTANFRSVIIPTWSNAHGMRGNTEIYFQFSDGNRIYVADGTQVAFGVQDYVVIDVRKTINLSNVSDAQKSSVRLFCICKGFSGIEQKQMYWYDITMTNVIAGG